MERELISKIAGLINNLQDCEEVDWFINTLNEYVCTFNYEGSKYIVTIEELEKCDESTQKDM